MSMLVDPTQQVLARALDGLSQRQSLISSNLTNIDTPGYQPKSVDFETALRQEAAAAGARPADATPPSRGPSADVGLLTTDPRQFSSASSALDGQSPQARTFQGSIRNDGNTVDLETELSALSETQLEYSAVGRLANGRLNQLSTVIGGN